MIAIFFTPREVLWRSSKGQASYALMDERLAEYKEYRCLPFFFRYKEDPTLGPVPIHCSPDLFVDLLIHLIPKEGFRDERINLNTLARYIGSNRSYLSETVNIFAGEHFSTFLTRIRIDQFKRLLGKHATGRLTYEGLAQEVGFASKSAFYRSFKLLEGISPAKYAQRIRES